MTSKTFEILGEEFEVWVVDIEERWVQPHLVAVPTRIFKTVEERREFARKCVRDGSDDNDFFIDEGDKQRLEGTHIAHASIPETNDVNIDWVKLRLTDKLRNLLVKGLSLL